MANVPLLGRGLANIALALLLVTSCGVQEQRVPEPIPKNRLPDFGRDGEQGARHLAAVVEEVATYEGARRTLCRVRSLRPASVRS